MIEIILNWLGFKYIYIEERGIFSHRYDATDLMAMRPIHNNMSVAHPNAYKAIVKKSFEIPLFNKDEKTVLTECVDAIDKIVERYETSDLPNVNCPALSDIKAYILIAKAKICVCKKV